MSEDYYYQLDKGVYTESEPTEYYKFKYEADNFQKWGFKAIEESHNILVTAHTGAGKTALAIYAIAKWLYTSQAQIIYCSPIKALSNQKYKEFLELFDKNNDERRFFNFYVENNSKTKHIGWDIPWIYKLILNKKLTVISAINLIKNIGFKSDPSGKGAQKFRNLRSSNIKFPLKIEQTHKANSFYDNYLYKSFYHRKNFLNRVFFKILKIIKK